MCKKRVGFLVDFAAPTFQQAHAFEIFDDVGSLYRIDHEPNLARGSLEPAVDGVDPDPLPRVSRWYAHRHPVTEHRAQLCLHNVPVTATYARTSLASARRVAVDVNRATVAPPVLGDPATNSRRRAVPGDMDLANNGGALQAIWKPQLLDDRRSAGLNVVVERYDERGTVAMQVMQRRAVRAGV